MQYRTIKSVVPKLENRVHIIKTIITTYSLVLACWTQTRYSGRQSAEIQTFKVSWKRLRFMTTYQTFDTTCNTFTGSHQKQVVKDRETALVQCLETKILRHFVSWGRGFFHCLMTCLYIKDIVIVVLFQWNHRGIRLFSQDLCRVTTKYATKLPGYV